MARIAGVDLPRDKRVEIALDIIFGIGKTTSQKILSTTGINPDTRVRDLTEDEVSQIRETIDKELKVEGDLRREICTEHQASDRDRLLPWNSSSSRSAGSRTTYENERSYSQRSSSYSSEQEEVIRGDNRKWLNRARKSFVLNVVTVKILKLAWRISVPLSTTRS